MYIIIKCFIFIASNESKFFKKIYFFSDTDSQFASLYQTITDNYKPSTTYKFVYFRVSKGFLLLLLLFCIPILFIPIVSIKSSRYIWLILSSSLIIL